MFGLGGQEILVLGGCAVVIAIIVVAATWTKSQRSTPDENDDS